MYVLWLATAQKMTLSASVRKTHKPWARGTFALLGDLYVASGPENILRYARYEELISQSSMKHTVTEKSIGPAAASGALSRGSGY
jgi:hypothetical protein